MRASEFLFERLKKVNGKWALVSKSNPKKVLQYYRGSGKPSDEWVKKVEQRVHAFSENKKFDLLEAPARIQHAEDLVFWEGSHGAKRALAALVKMATRGHKDVSIKWDGSVAIIFGRDENGDFIMTDKSGFSAKGYDGRAKSSKQLTQMILGRSKGEPDESRKAFARRFGKLFDIYDKAVPKDFRGFFKGDLLYFTTPPIINGAFEFTPNVVTYRVAVDSELGKKIKKSISGIVIHRIVDSEGNEHPLTDYDIFEGDSVLVIPPVSVSHAADVDLTMVKKVEAIIQKDGPAIDTLLNKEVLRTMQLSDFANILYTYTNSKVGDRLDNLGDDFLTWLKGSRVSAKKQSRIADYVKEHELAFSSLWEVVKGIMAVKDDIIKQFDSHPADIEASIGSSRGGEGYVHADPSGDIKLVNRSGFTAANRAVQR